MGTFRILFLLLIVGPASIAATRTATATRAPTNVRVTHDRYPNHAEPYLAVNPHNARNLLGAAQYLNASGLARAGTFVSFDGGQTWRDNGLLPMPAGFNTSLDVTIVFDAAGNGLVAALLSNAARDTFSRNRGIAVWRTSDGGRTFSQPVVVLRGRFADHPWLAIDPPTVRHGRIEPQTVYLAWANDSGLSFTRSTDDGRAFSPVQTILHTNELAGDPVLVAGPRGMVSVAYIASSDGQTFSIRVISSTNSGRRFGPPHTVSHAPGQRLLFGKGSPSSRIAAAADGPRRLLYIAYAASVGHAGSAAIMLARSADDGRTWDRPIRVDTSSPTVTVNQQPQLAVGPGGQVFVSYFALARGRMSVYLSESDTRGTRFRQPRRISAASFDPALGIRSIERGQWWIGDYQGLAAGTDGVYACWNDTRSGRLEIYVAAILR